MSFMKFLAFLGLVACIVYLWFFRKPVVVHERTTNNTIIMAETPIKRLSAFVDTHMDAIFRPLTSDETLMPAQELRQISRTLEDLRSHAVSEKDKRLYAVGMSLCSRMSSAIKTREEHNRRLADMQQKGFESLLGKADAQRKKDFFESSVKRSWEEKATKIRERILQEYDQMRLLER